MISNAAKKLNYEGIPQKLVTKESTYIDVNSSTVDEIEQSHPKPENQRKITLEKSYSTDKAKLAEFDFIKSSKSSVIIKRKSR